MSKLIQKTNEIENYILTKRKLLITAKLSFLSILLIVFIKAYFFMIPKVNHYKISWLTFNLLEGLIFLILFIPFIIKPLHYFISDRIMNQFNWDIKYCLFQGVLDQFNTNYTISYKSALPDDDIKLLQLERKFITFIYGDDLIFGTLNNTRFRLSEMHVCGFYKRYFDGLIAVLVYDFMLDPNIVQEKTKELPENIEIKLFDNKIYFIFKGDRQYFELKIKKKKVNEEELLIEKETFHQFIQLLDNWSNYFQKQSNDSSE